MGRRARSAAAMAGDAAADAQRAIIAQTRKRTPPLLPLHNPNTRT